MTILWIVLSFIAGMLFWNQVGTRIFAKGIKNEKVLAGVLRGLNNKSLWRFYGIVQGEVNERKEATRMWEREQQ